MVDFDNQKYLSIFFFLRGGILMKADEEGRLCLPHTPTVHLLQDSEISFPKRDVSTLSKLESIMTKAFVPV